MNQGGNYNKHMKVNKNLTIDNLIAIISMDLQRKVEILKGFELILGDTPIREVLFYQDVITVLDEVMEGKENDKIPAER